MRRKYNNRHEYDENSSQHVFALRKDKKLLEAYNLAFKLYEEDPNDEWVERAYLWTLIAIVEQKISPSTPSIPLPTGDKQVFIDKILSSSEDTIIFSNPFVLESCESFNSSKEVSENFLKFFIGTLSEEPLTGIKPTIFFDISDSIHAI